MKTQTCNAKSIAFIGMLGALSAVLMFINVPLPFAPTFLKFDIAELLALFAGFFLGLVSGCACYYILFFLSVMAPMKSERKFWRVIHKIREGMDLTVYCFFYICAILTILYVVWMVVHGWIEAYF